MSRPFNNISALFLSMLFCLNFIQAEETAKKTSPNPVKVTKTSSTQKTKYKKNTVLEFDGRSVDGNVVSPDSADVEGDKNLRFEPLLEGRKDFKREFKRSSGVSR